MSWIIKRSESNIKKYEFLLSSVLMKGKYQRTWTLFHCLLAHVLGLLLIRNIRQRVWIFCSFINFLDLILKDISKLLCTNYCSHAKIASILITRLIVIVIALTVLFCNCPPLKDITFSTKCLLVWCD